MSQESSVEWTPAREQFLVVVMNEQIRKKTNEGAFNWNSASEATGMPALACRVKYNELRGKNELLMNWNDWFLIKKQGLEMEELWILGYNMRDISDRIGFNEKRPVHEIEIRRWHDTYLTPEQRGVFDAMRAAGEDERAVFGSEEDGVFEREEDSI